MGKGSLWTIEEENLLKEQYLQNDKEELLKMFPNRTWKAIKNKAKTFELKRSNDYDKIPDCEIYKTINGVRYKICKNCREYHPLELKYFPKDLSCNDGFRNICKQCKGENFNVSNAQQWSEDELKLLIDNYSNYTNEDLIDKFFPQRKSKHLCDKASKLGLNKSNEILSKTRKDTMTSDVKIKISKFHIINGTFKGENNPMYGSNRVGEINPNWKGGVCSEKENFMRTDEYKRWRKDVFERDNYTCQCCNRMTHDVEAHHLNNFADFKDERLLVENGITLCKNCHNPNKKGSFHNIYGTLHNTKEQFEEYLINKRNKFEEVS